MSAFHNAEANVDKPKAIWKNMQKLKGSG